MLCVDREIEYLRPLRPIHTEVLTMSTVIGTYSFIHSFIYLIIVLIFLFLWSDAWCNG